MSAKIFCLPLAISMQLLSAEAFSAVYCGVVNGVQVWDELVPSDCTRALRQMQLSNEHIQSSQKGQRIEKSYSAPSSKAVENAVTSFGNYMQQRSDEKDEQERRSKASAEAEEEQVRQSKLQNLSKHIIPPVPIDKIQSMSCNGSLPGFGVVDLPPFEDNYLASRSADLYKILNLSQLKVLAVEQKGKRDAIAKLQELSTTFDTQAVSSFQRMAVRRDYSSEIVIEMANNGRTNDLRCDISNNTDLCDYMYSRWSAMAVRSSLLVAQKCLE